MSKLSFDKDLFDSIGSIPEDLRSLELYPKLQSLTNHIITRFAEDFEDIRFKYSGPGSVRSEVITEIIDELGFEYVTGIMKTINGVEFNTLLYFISLINLLKGSRQGMELILKLLGFDSDIKEWWQKDPKGEPHTFEILITMDQNQVPNVFETIDKVKIFSRAYVFPLVENVDFKFSFSFAERNATLAGFFHARYVIPIRGRI